jgi:hypothetical protein
VSFASSCPFIAFSGCAAVLAINEQNPSLFFRLVILFFTALRTEFIVVSDLLITFVTIFHDFSLFQLFTV